MPRSLRARFILLVCLAFLPLLALTGRDLVRERDLLLRRSYDIAERRVENALADQRDLMDDGRRYLGAVALLAPVAQGESDACGRTVERVRALLDENWSFERVGPDGRVDCPTTTNSVQAQMVTQMVTQSASGTSTRPAPPVDSPVDSQVDSQVDAQVSSPTELKEPSRALPMRGLIVSGYGFDRATGVPVVRLETSLADTSGVRRRLAITMQLTWVMTLARELARDERAVVALVDGNRNVIVRAPAHGVRAGTRAPASSVYDSMATQRNGRMEAVGVDGVRRLWTFRELPSPSGTSVLLIHGVPSDPLHAAANRQVLKSVLSIGATLLLLMVAIWWAAERFFLRDVRTLLDATQSIARGELSARTGLVEHDGELGQLAAAFDGMASRLQDRQERLAHAQKMESVGQLAGGVAHDFNNLLTAIVANTEAAKEDLPSDHAVQVELDQVLHAARRSGQLTRQLLAFARQHTLATRVLTLDRLLENVSALLVRLIGEHIELRVESDPELRATRVDPVQIEQAIINLAVNARDAMPTGGTLTIAVRNLTLHAPLPGLEEVDPAGTWVAITVSDTGVGMPPDVLRHVFEPFFTTKPVGEGTGLGLAMVYGTARQHGGHVRVTSDVGKGTTVRMLLPVDESAELSNETPAFGLSLAGTGRGDETILLVEDEAAVRAVGARLLRSRGYTVIEAPDGEIALAMMDGEALAGIDMVVTDLVMPKVGGVDMVDALRQRRPRLPALLVSGYSASGVPAALLSAPLTEFLEKPFNARSLLGAVRALLESAAVARV